MLLRIRPSTSFRLSPSYFRFSPEGEVGPGPRQVTIGSFKYLSTTTTNSSSSFTISTKRTMSPSKFQEKRIFLIRHGQAYHNLTYPPSYHLSDPSLTPVGVIQATSLSTSPDVDFSEVELIVASPLRRTIQTALLGLGPTIQRLSSEREDQKGLLLLPQVQEVGCSACDTGSGIPDLKAEFGEVEGIDWHILEGVGEKWNCKKGQWGNGEQVLRERARCFRNWLRDREENVIAVVAHHNILEYITAGRRLRASWYNCETREYRLTASNPTEDAQLELLTPLPPPSSLPITPITPGFPPSTPVSVAMELQMPPASPGGTVVEAK